MFSRFSIFSAARPSILVRLSTLIGLSFLMALLWRWEIEFHGWDGLRWTGYFHWSVPIGILLFAAWLVQFSGLASLADRRRLAQFFIVKTTVLTMLLYVSLWFFFVTGPTALAAQTRLGELLFSLLQLSIGVLYPGVLVMDWMTARRFGLVLNCRIYGLSLLLFFGAVPLALLWIKWAEPGLPVDLIHTIKTGHVFPFILLGLGLPFLGADRADRAID
jgi:hypothetical protein